MYRHFKTDGRPVEKFESRLRSRITRLAGRSRDERSRSKGMEDDSWRMGKQVQRASRFELQKGRAESRRFVHGCALSARRSCAIRIRTAHSESTKQRQERNLR